MGLILTGCFSLLNGTATSSEPVQEFLNGLHRRHYFDTAVYYLETLEADDQLPASERELLTFRRGVTDLLGARHSVQPAEQTRKLESAVALFTRFLQSSHRHPWGEQARGLLSEARLQLAQRRIQEQESALPQSGSEEFWKGIRTQIDELRILFIQQRDRSEDALRNYSAYIPQDESELRRSRDRVQELFIRSSLDLAQCDYWEAHTHVVNTKERQQLLIAAGRAYEAIHQRFRSQVGGLYARLWQGKCYEELGDEQGVRLALGIYGEILEHDGTSPLLVSLKDRALLFRLICLNSPFRKDYQLVDLEAEQWLESAPQRIDTEAGLGIQWELCRALEFLSRENKWPMEIREDFLARARTHLIHLQQVTGGKTREFQELMRRIAP